MTEALRILPDHVVIGHGPVLGFFAECACHAPVEPLGETPEQILNNSMLQRAARWAREHACTWRAA